MRKGGLSQHGVLRHSSHGWWPFPHHHQGWVTRKELAREKRAVSFRALVLWFVFRGGASAPGRSRTRTAGGREQWGPQGVAGQGFSRQGLSHHPSQAAGQGWGQPGSTEGPDHQLSSWRRRWATVKLWRRRVGWAPELEDLRLWWRWRPGFFQDCSGRGWSRNGAPGLWAYRCLDMMWLNRTALQLQIYAKESQQELCHWLQRLKIRS